VFVFDRLDSTNSYAAMLASDRANDGVVVLAAEQTAGRGQHGRNWQCPAGSGVLLSLLLFPPDTLRRPALLTAWAAVSVTETIHQATGLQATIKWPNDVLLRGRKVCGILIEQTRGTVLGIGLNVNQSAESLATALLPEASSLAVAAGARFDCADVARTLIAELDREYDALCRGDLQSLETRWREGIGLLGKDVVVECHDAVYRGRLRELAFGGLCLEVTPGETRRLLPESVRHLASEPEA
jgi:BirA family biotin operon repressor/biotin-[acetyl-CoA-carboxylase] ligase